MRTKKFWNILIFGVVIFIFFMPIMRLILLSFRTESGYGLEIYKTILSEPKTWKTIFNTLYISFSSTIIAVVLGVSFAWIVAYTDVKNKLALEFFILMPFIIPSYITTLSWAQFTSKSGLLASLLAYFGGQPLNIYSYKGIILVMGLCHSSLVYLLTVNVFRKIPRNLELAARVSGNNGVKTFFKINIPLAAPGILGGMTLAFFASMDNFGIPAFLGIPANIRVMSTYIYEQVIGFGPSSFSRAAVLSVILALMALTGALIQSSILKKSNTYEVVKDDNIPRVALKKWRKPLEYILWMFLIFVNIIPMISMVLTSLIKAYGMKIKLENLTFKHYYFILFESQKTKNALLNSFSLALLCTVVCIIVGTTIAYMKVRKPTAGTRFLESIISIPYALPGIVLSLSMIFHWAQPIPGWKPNIYGTVKILIIAYITRYLILQVNASSSTIYQLDIAMEEAARVSGANFFNKWKKIILPMILPGILSGSFLIMISSLTELTLSSLLASVGTETIGMTIFNFQQGGYINYATTFSSIVILLIWIFYFLLKVVPKIKLKEDNI